jgi:stearoyl-CoA desaturase (delta-9 desaturase)
VRGVEGAERVPLSQKVVTGVLVFGPLVGTLVALPLLWGRFVDVTDLVLAAILYLIPCVGVTVGYHRLFTHRSFKANRPLRIALAIAGSLAVEGSVTDWVATHRRHHRYSDIDGDPHSPHRYGEGSSAIFRGLIYAHVGWLFVSDATCVDRYAPDIAGDRDLQRISRWFPGFALISLFLPALLGYALAGTLSGAVTAFVWAGLLRMTLLHHVTWSVNSICHTFGNRRYSTKDYSTDVAILAVLSLGESWHNGHHAHPAWARHGAEQGQLDISAEIIRLFERAGWATKVRWPATAALCDASPTDEDACDLAGLSEDGAPAAERVPETVA